MRTNHHESKTQQACVRWFRLQYPQHLIIAIPNGGQRSPVEAAIMQAEGVVAGVPDLMILLNTGKIFFVEMKYGKNKLSENQKVMHSKLKTLGFNVYTCYSFDDFFSVVNNAIKGEPGVFFATKISIS